MTMDHPNVLLKMRHCCYCCYSWQLLPFYCPSDHPPPWVDTAVEKTFLVVVVGTAAAASVLDTAELGTAAAAAAVGTVVENTAAAAAVVNTWHWVDILAVPN